MILTSFLTLFKKLLSIQFQMLRRQPHPLLVAEGEERGHVRVMRTTYRHSSFVKITEIENSKNSVSIPDTKMMSVRDIVGEWSKQHNQWGDELHRLRDNKAELLSYCHRRGFFTSELKTEKDDIGAYYKILKEPGLATVYVCLSFIRVDHDSENLNWLAHPVANLSICKYAGSKDFETGVNFQGREGMQLIMKILDDFMPTAPVVVQNPAAGFFEHGFMQMLAAQGYPPFNDMAHARELYEKSQPGSSRKRLRSVEAVANDDDDNEVVELNVEEKEEVAAATRAVEEELQAECSSKRNETDEDEESNATSSLKKMKKAKRSLKLSSKN
jgi:hypothetical protein